MRELNLLHQWKTSGRDRELMEATPSLQVCALVRGKKTLHVQLGRDYRFYDWASLTKVVFTVGALIHLEDRQKFHPSRRVQDYVPFFPSDRTRIRDLLSHVSGLKWWNDFFRELPSGLPASEQRWHLARLLRQERPKSPVTESVYSDLDFLWLIYVLENCAEKPLEMLADREIARSPMKTAHFCRGNQPVYSRSLYAPTESCRWRKRVLQGEVHDENCSALGGVSTHAGLFGSMDDLVAWGQWWRQGWGVRSEIWERYLSRQIPARKGDWALGMMMPTSGKASCGERMDRGSVGHTGFTGTSFWWDRKKDVMILILSNRVHPTRENKTFVGLRPKIHDDVMSVLGY